MITTGTKYKRQSIIDYNADLPYIDLSITGNLPVIAGCIFIFMISAVVIPFLPPLHYYDSKWTMPESLTEYYSRMKNVFYLFIIVVSLVLFRDFLTNIRTFIDRLFGYKKVGVFQVTTVWHLFARKLIFFNNLHFISLTKYDFGFEEIKTGIVMKVELTATNNLIVYQIIKD